MTRTEHDRSGINQPGRNLSGDGKIGKDRNTTGQEGTGLIS
jgi:hypothetical protein